MVALAESLIFTDQEQSINNSFLTRFGSDNLVSLGARPWGVMNMKKKNLLLILTSIFIVSLLGIITLVLFNPLIGYWSDGRVYFPTPYDVKTKTRTLYQFSGIKLNEYSFDSSNIVKNACYIWFYKRTGIISYELQNGNHIRKMKVGLFKATITYKENGKEQKMILYRDFNLIKNSGLTNQTTLY